VASLFLLNDLDAMSHVPSAIIGAEDEEDGLSSKYSPQSQDDRSGKANRCNGCFMVLVVVLNVCIVVSLVISSQRAETAAVANEAVANKLNELEAVIQQTKQQTQETQKFAAAIQHGVTVLQNSVKVPDKSGEVPDKSGADSYGHPEWLSKCREFFFDVGANIGTHGRKMFEPSKYPDAPYLQIFNDNFGPETWRAELNSSRCYIGIEANPAHMARLKEVEGAYLSQGWKWHSYNFGAWYIDGTMTIQTEADPDHSNWGAHLDFAAANPGREVKKSESVRVIDLNDFVTDVIARAMPHAKIYLMKMDIEGAEWEVLHFMIKSGTFCSDIIGTMTIEAHDSGSKENWGWAAGTNAEIEKRLTNQPACATRGGPTKVMFMDDESYLLDGVPLP